jgi:hypothetical protein
MPPVPYGVRPHRVPNRLAERHLELLSDPLGHRPGGDPPRLRVRDHGAAELIGSSGGYAIGSRNVGLSWAPGTASGAASLPLAADVWFDPA